MPIADAIQLAISLQSPAVDAQGFGTPLVLTTAGTLTLNTPSFYTTPQALLDDAGAGIINTDDVYKALVDMFSQPNVSKVAVARIDALVAQETKATITAASGAGTATWTATMVVQGLSYVANYTEDGTPTVTEIRDGLKAALEAITVPGGIPATIANDGVDAMDITASSAGWEFSLEITNDGDGTATVANTTPAVTVAGGAGAVFGVDPVGWYGISFAGASDLQVADLAVWAETVRKMHGATATGAGNKTAAADSLFVKLAAQSFVRTVALYNDSGDYAGEAWLANRLAVNPDQRSTIWAFVTLPSVTIGNETTTEQTAIEGTNSNYYAEMGASARPTPGAPRATSRLTSSRLLTGCSSACRSGIRPSSSTTRTGAARCHSRTLASPCSKLPRQRSCSSVKPSGTSSRARRWSLSQPLRTCRQQTAPRARFGSLSTPSLLGPSRRWSSAGPSPSH